MCKSSEDITSKEGDHSISRTDSSISETKDGKIMATGSIILRFHLFDSLFALVTTILSFVIILLGITTHSSITLSRGKIPEWMAWMSTLGLTGGVLVYYSFSTVPVCSTITLVLLCIVCGLVGSPLSIIYEMMVSLADLNAATQNQISCVTKKDMDRLEKILEKICPKKNLDMLKKNAKVALEMLQAILGKIQPVPVRAVFILVMMPELWALKKCASQLWYFVYRKQSHYFTASELGMQENNYPNELWIHVNGIMNNKEAAADSCRVIHEMFGRPVDLLHNPTDGAIPDLIQCVAGKTGLLKAGVIKPRVELTKRLAGKLRGAKANGIDKVVLIAHSQGTIITGNVISNLGLCEKGEEVVDEELDSLMKELLEVYIIAGCAHHIPNRVKHVEYLSNRGDIVAWLGDLFPRALAPFWKNTWGNGIMYYRGENTDHVENAWGHMLVPHYLDAMKNGKFAQSKLASVYMKEKGE